MFAAKVAPSMRFPASFIKPKTKDNITAFAVAHCCLHPPLNLNLAQVGRVFGWPQRPMQLPQLKIARTAWFARK